MEVELPTGGTGAQTPGNLFGKQVLAGGIAGMLADAVMYPMMTVKSRLQVQGGATAGGGGGAASMYMYRGPMHAIYSISAKEGWRTLYKGYATVGQIAPAQALYMATYQTSKKVLPGGEENPLVHFCGGVIATLVQSSVMVPTEVIRQRQMVQTTGGEGAYTGSLHAARTIYQLEGAAALYRGFLLAQMVWGPYNAIYLPLWEASKKVAVKFSEAESKEKLAVQYELGSAFFSASIASALTNPADIIKTRLQVQGKSNVNSSTHYNGALDAARSIYRKEGVRGFTKGMSSRVLWVAPSATIMFTTYDQLMKRFNRMW
ncbi:hypothetical protein MPTK1_7g05190 [Marchantia polymorpha subsp. ruderalis]|nr:hypothetical protein MARPO_0062s0006 [Marchantia polymorpha]BBN16303.1 hypothetical protein Mp_7g05190 [Marchantia polymorpha subsp. ruderalis]|eukprot:PTQ36578.1 hypothetical protein MARPO_0062s0006 [Marchantia polymorpha]